MSGHARIAYIHIGPHKCGSTAIQRACNTAREELFGFGYHYLSGDENHSKFLASIFWDDDVAIRMGMLEWIDDIDRFHRYRDELRDRMILDIETSSPKNLIISGEELSRFSASEAERLVKFLRDHYDDVKVIAYVREPFSWINSNAQQTLKWEGATLDEVMTSPPLPEYRRRFAPYLACVGPERFEIRFFDSQSDGNFDVVTDFFSAIGADLMTPSMERTKTYKAITWRTATLLSAINAFARPFVNYRYNPTRSYKIVEEICLPGEKFCLPRETISKVSDRLVEEREWMSSVLGRDIPPSPLADVERAKWFRDERELLESHGLLMNNSYRRQQNEISLRNLWQASKGALSSEETIRRLSIAWRLATDRWTLLNILKEVQKVEHPELRCVLARIKLLRKIENPLPEDAPLVFGNPLDRF